MCKIEHKFIYIYLCAYYNCTYNCVLFIIGVFPKYIKNEISQQN